LCETTPGKCYASKALPERQVSVTRCRYFEGRYLSDPVLYNIIIGLAVLSGGKNKSVLNAQAILVKGKNSWQMILQDIRIQKHYAFPFTCVVYVCRIIWYLYIYLTGPIKCDQEIISMYKGAETRIYNVYLLRKYATI